MSERAAALTAVADIPTALAGVFALVVFAFCAVVVIVEMRRRYLHRKLSGGVNLSRHVNRAEVAAVFELPAELLDALPPTTLEVCLAEDARRAEELDRISPDAASGLPADTGRLR